MLYTQQQTLHPIPKDDPRRIEYKRNNTCFLLLHAITMNDEVHDKPLERAAQNKSESGAEQKHEHDPKICDGQAVDIPASCASGGAVKIPRSAGRKARQEHRNNRVLWRMPDHRG